MSEKIAFQGTHGAYSEQALKEVFGLHAQSLSCRYLEHVFDAVETQQAAFGIVPVENSSAGSIYRTYDLLSEHAWSITGEHYLKINHCLLTLPGTRRQDIKKVFSHSQALDQCHAFLTQLGLEEHPFFDTAGAAAWVAEQKNPQYAAVAGRLAADHHHLEVMAANIQTYPHNTTRFLVLAKTPSNAKGACKTSLVFETRHLPAALYKCLGGFASNGINLTKLESRPSQAGMGRYRFYLDFEAHAQDPAADRALRELAFFTVSVRILGSYPRTSIPA